MSWLPSFEAQTIVSIIIGAVISIGTYWLGQRRARGAEDERIRAANAQLVSAVVRRVAVDRQVMPGTHYEFIRAAKSQEAGIDRAVLLDLEQAKARVFSAVIENDFLEVVSKNTIIDLLAAGVADDEPRIRGKEGARESAAYSSGGNLILGFISLAVGAFGALLSSSGIFEWVANNETRRAVSSGWVEVLLLTVVAIFVGVRLYSVLGSRERREKDPGEETPDNVD